jgi:DNA polymerase III subunit delta
MRLKPEALAGQLARNLAPAYLLAGDEPLLLLEACDEVRKSARERGFVEREVFDTSLNVDADDLHYATQAMGLFGGAKLIELRLKEGKLDKKLSEFVQAFCTRASADLCLLISVPEWRKEMEKLAWVQAVEDCGITMVSYAPKRAELPAWLQRRARGYKLNLSPEAAEMLSDRVEGNLLAAQQELSKLASFGKQSNISVELIEQMVADQAHFDVFTLANSMLLGEAARAVRILRSLQQEGEEAFSLMSWLLREVELTAQLASAQEAGKLEEEFAVRRFWPAKSALYRSALKRGGAAHWRDLVIDAAKVDQTLKGRGAGEPWLSLERWLLTVALPPRSGLVFRAA